MIVAGYVLESTLTGPCQLLRRKLKNNIPAWSGLSFASQTQTQTEGRETSRTIENITKTSRIKSIAQIRNKY